jgi:hypothetical protein
MSLSLCDLDWPEVDDAPGLLFDREDWPHFVDLELDDGPEVDSRSGGLLLRKSRPSSSRQA